MLQQFRKSISNPCSLYGGDIWTTSTRRTMPHFNPRSPCEERQLRTAFQIRRVLHFNPLPVRGSDPEASPTPARFCKFQSTLRASDWRLRTWGWVGRYDFNPRSPCGGDLTGSVPPGCCPTISPTIHPLPVRGATRLGSWNWTLPIPHFNQSSPCGGDLFESLLLFCCYISVHAPRASTSHDVMHWFPIHDFQSTLPVRGAT